MKKRLVVIISSVVLAFSLSLIASKEIVRDRRSFESVPEYNAFGEIVYTASVFIAPVSLLVVLIFGLRHAKSTTRIVILSALSPAMYGLFLSLDHYQSGVFGASAPKATFTLSSFVVVGYVVIAGIYLLKNSKKAVSAIPLVFLTVTVTAFFVFNMSTTTGSGCATEAMTTDWGLTASDSSTGWPSPWSRGPTPPMCNDIGLPIGG